MSELLREAILGTAHSGARGASPADGLVSKLDGLERERALLLRAASEALLRRAARVLPQRRSQLQIAAPESMRPSSQQLTAALRWQLAQDAELIEETLSRMARAGVRLAPELLPLALEQTEPALRDLLRPVLGQRGLWLAKQRPEWQWALSPGEGGLPDDFDRRWSDGNAVERRQLLMLLRKQEPARARELAAETLRQERAEQRAAFVEAFAISLSPDDQAFLSSLLADRSALVQRSAARLLWRLPGSEVAARMLARARAHVRFAAQEGHWHVSLPTEPLDADWLRDGIIERPPDASPLGQRQWWLQQLVAAVPCAVWGDQGRDAGKLSLAHDQVFVRGAGSVDADAQGKRAADDLAAEQLAAAAAGHAFAGVRGMDVGDLGQSATGAVAAEQLVAAAARHEFAGALLDGLTRAALQYDERSWFVHLWDAWANSELASAMAPDPRVLLSQKLTAQDIALRAQQLVSEDKLRVLLAHLPRPWPEPLALRVLAAISDLRLSFREVIPVAALAIPVALLPDALPLPESSQVQYPLRAYVRALADFQEVAALRRSIAAETIADD